MSRWIRVHTAILRNPKVKELARLSKWTIKETVGNLILFWGETLEHCDSGIFDGWSKSKIGGFVFDESEQADRFYDNLLASGLLDENPLRVHDWMEFALENIRSKYQRTPERFDAIKKRWDGFGKSMPPAPKMPPPEVKQEVNKMRKLKTVAEHKEKEKREKTPYQVLTEFFAEYRGVILENQAQNTLFFKTHGSPIKELLDLCGGDMVKAKKAIVEAGAYLDKLVLEGKIPGWHNAQAIVNQFTEWNQEQHKEALNQAPHMPEISEEPFAETEGQEA